LLASSIFVFVPIARADKKAARCPAHFDVRHAAYLHHDCTTQNKGSSQEGRTDLVLCAKTAAMAQTLLNFNIAGELLGPSVTKEAEESTERQRQLRDALEIRQLQCQSPWQMFVIPQLIVGALVFLSVLAWIEYIFFDFKNVPNENTPDAPPSDDGAGDEPIPVAPSVRKYKKRLVGRVIPSAPVSCADQLSLLEQKRQRGVYALILTSATIGVVLVLGYLQRRRAIQNLQQRQIIEDLPA
jgi:hypothetical protein